MACEPISPWVLLRPAVSGRGPGVPLGRPPHAPFLSDALGPYTAVALISFLGQLKRHFRRRHVTLLWDGLPAHRSRRMRDYLAQQREWLTVERVPAYAPDLNPAEPLFGNVKGPGSPAATSLRRHSRRS